MWRRGRYEQLKNNAADSDSDCPLEFVGTAAELVSPHRFRYRPPPPPFFDSLTQSTRQGAGRDTPKAPATPATSAASHATADQISTKVIGILYFMSWTVSFFFCHVSITFCNFSEIH